MKVMAEEGAEAPALAALVVVGHPGTRLEYLPRSEQKRLTSFENMRHECKINARVVNAQKNGFGECQRDLLARRSGTYYRLHTPILRAPPSELCPASPEPVRARAMRLRFISLGLLP